jgi:hypothetical protein
MIRAVIDLIRNEVCVVSDYASSHGISKRDDGQNDGNQQVSSARWPAIDSTVRAGGRC